MFLKQTTCETSGDNGPDGTYLIMNHHEQVIVGVHQNMNFPFSFTVMFANKSLLYNLH